MIRVLQVVTKMDRGGLETMIMNYYRNIDKSKIQFDFLVHRKERGAYDDEIEKLGGKIYRLQKLNPFSLKYRKSLNLFFKDHKEYSIVHSHINCLSALILKYAKKNGVKNRFSHSHISDNISFSVKNMVKLFYRNKLCKYTTKRFACGEKAGNWLYKGKDFTVIPNAIDATKFRYNYKNREIVRKELGISNDTLVIGHVGRFTEQKNHKFILDVFKKINSEVSDSALVLVGTGELYEDIRSYANEKGVISNVYFLGVRNDIEIIMQSLNVFLLPSLFEGLPVTIVEAQAAGIQCVISDNVSSECILTKNVCSLSLNIDIKEWAEKIIELSKKDPTDTYNEIVSNNYDINSNCKYLERIYEEANNNV